MNKVLLKMAVVEKNIKTNKEIGRATSPFQDTIVDNITVLLDKIRTCGY